MGKQLNWGRVKQNKEVREGRQFQFDQQQKIDRKYAAYRNGQFYIGTRHVERWDPRKKKFPGDGVFLNQVTGNFEIWFRAQRRSFMNWRNNWKALVAWADRNGVAV